LIARLDPATYQDALAERTVDVAVKRAALKDSELNYGRNLSLLKEDYKYFTLPCLVAIITTTSVLNCEALR
jgi:hypothetical protein